MSITEAPTTRTRRRFAPLGFVAAAATVLALVGGATPAYAAPGDTLVAGGPTLTVSKVTNVANTNVLTISGSGYDATTISPSTGAVAGFYLSIGSLDTTNGWRPSLNKPSTSRSTSQTVWVHPGGSGAGEANLTSSGTFSTTITVAPQYALASGFTSAVFTIGSHGFANAAQEQAKQIGYTGTTTTAPSPGSGTPSLAVTKNTSTQTYYVSGTGFGGAGALGVYASIGVIKNTGWKPSAGNASSTRSASDTFWVWSGGPTTPASGQAKLTSGTFAVSLSYASLPTLPTGYSYAVYTMGAHGVTNASVETASLITP